MFLTFLLNSFTDSTIVVVEDTHDGERKRSKRIREDKESLRSKLEQAFEIALGDPKTEEKAQEIIQTVSKSELPSIQTVDWSRLEANETYKSWLLNVIRERQEEEEIAVTLLLQ